MSQFSYRIRSRGGVGYQKAAADGWLWLRMSPRRVRLAQEAQQRRMAEWRRIHGDVPVATGGQFLPLAGPGTTPRARFWSLPPQWMTLNIRWRQVQQVPPNQGSARMRPDDGGWR